jgi:hypothetical protein
LKPVAKRQIGYAEGSPGSESPFGRFGELDSMKGFGARIETNVWRKKS